MKEKMREEIEEIQNPGYDDPDDDHQLVTAKESLINGEVVVSYSIGKTDNDGNTDASIWEAESTFDVNDLPGAIADDIGEKIDGFGAVVYEAVKEERAVKVSQGIEEDDPYERVR